MVERLEKAACSGCGACRAACPERCIEMRADEEGFLYPQAEPGLCTGCGECLRLCPAQGRPAAVSEPAAYGCVSRDDETLRLSTSGGIFSLLAADTIRRGGIVCGARYGADLTVEHAAVSTMEDAAAFRGSKYAQSATGDVYEAVRAALSDGLPVLFSGTPCQIAGLRALPYGRHELLLCVDLVCHGTASPKAWSRYLQWRRKQLGDLSGIRLRSKARGWLASTVELRAGERVKYVPQADDPFMRGYLADMFLRPSCYECPFKGLGRDSDLTLGDLWGGADIAPSVYSGAGTSLLLVHSPRGADALSRIGDGMRSQRIDPQAAALKNPLALRPAHRPPSRDRFFPMLETTGFPRAVSGLLPGKSLKSRLRGLARRILRGR